MRKRNEESCNLLQLQWKSYIKSECPKLTKREDKVEKKKNEHISKGHMGWYISFKEKNKAKEELFSANGARPRVGNEVVVKFWNHVMFQCKNVLFIYFIPLLGFQTTFLTIYCFCCLYEEQSICFKSIHGCTTFHSLCNYGTYFLIHLRGTYQGL